MFRSRRFCVKRLLVSSTDQPTCRLDPDVHIQRLAFPVVGRRWPAHHLPASLARIVVRFARVPNDVALFDLGPLRATLERLVDFNLLNDGRTRLTVCCIDMETGDEVQFDTRGQDRA